MAQLRDKMHNNLTLRGMRPQTVQTYLGCVQRFVDHFGLPPGRLGAEHVQQYQLFLRTQKKASLATQNVYAGALRFFYETTMGRPHVGERSASSRSLRSCVTKLEQANSRRIRAAELSDSSAPASGAGDSISMAAETTSTNGVSRQTDGRAAAPRCGVGSSGLLGHFIARWWWKIARHRLPKSIF